MGAVWIKDDNVCDLADANLSEFTYKVISFTPRIIYYYNNVQYRAGSVARARCRAHLH